MQEKITIKEGFFHKIEGIIDYSISKEKNNLPLIIITHGLHKGLFEYKKDLYKNLANSLNQLGYTTVRFGFTMKIDEGVGTKGEKISLREFDLQTESHDLMVLINYLLQNYKDKLNIENIVLVGHSFAATVLGFTYLKKMHELNNIKGLALLCPKVLYDKNYIEWENQSQEQIQAKKYFFPWPNSEEHKNIAIKKSFLEKNAKHSKSIQKGLELINKKILIIISEEDKKYFREDYKYLSELSKNNNISLIQGYNKHNLSGEEEKAAAEIHNLFK